MKFSQLITRYVVQSHHGRPQLQHHLAGALHRARERVKPKDLVVAMKALAA
jgi:hypothetical protein